MDALGGQVQGQIKVKNHKATGLTVHFHRLYQPALVKLAVRDMINVLFNPRKPENRILEKTF